MNAAASQDVAARGRSLDEPRGLHEVELSDPIRDFDRSSSAHDALSVLVRLHGFPLGVVDMQFAAAPSLSGADIAGAVFALFGSAINDHLVDDGLAPITSLPLDGVSRTGARCLARLELVRRSGPGISVVVPTRESPEVVVDCVRSILRSPYPRGKIEVIVVESAPADRRTHDALATAFGADARVRYVPEHAMGAANARNRGWRLASLEIVAFADGDVQADSGWLDALALAFVSDDSLSCVTGLVLPVELETEAQVLLEQFGGYAKGFQARRFDLSSNEDSDPLYPYRAGAFGTGANMAFRREALAALGGFDPLLGPGTPTLSGDDSELLLRTIVRGYRIGYQPAAIVRHPSEPEMDRLERQIYGYGVGLSAHLLSLLIAHPWLVADVLSRIPDGLRFALRASSSKNRHRGASYPPQLSRAELRGIAWGPVAYGVSLAKALRCSTPVRRP